MARKNKDDNRDGRDMAGTGPDPKDVRHLAPLKELKRVKVAGDDPDIRGWSVFTSSGRRVGEVEDLLIDTSVGEVVMLDIDLADQDRHTLAPIRAAWVDRENKRVVLDGAQFDAEQEIPSLHRRQDLTDDEVRSFRDGYDRAYGDHGWDDSDTHVRHGRDELRFGRRSAELGADEASERRYEREVERRAAREDDWPYQVQDEEQREVRLRDRHERQHTESFDRDRQDRDRQDRDRGDRDRSARDRDRPEGIVVEETVIRRRIVDPSEEDISGDGRR